MHRNLPVLVLGHVDSNCTRIFGTGALVVLEFPRREFLLEHLVDFFEGAIFGLWEDKPDKYENDEVGRAPDVPVFAALHRLLILGRVIVERFLLTQFNSKGFKKYGAVKVATQFQANDTPIAKPRVYPRRRCVGISPAQR